MRWLQHVYFDSILRQMRLTVSALLKRPALVFGGVVLLTVLGLVLQTRSHIFTLDVITEIAAFTTTDPVLTAWDLGVTSRWIDDPFEEDATGSKLEPHAQLIIHENTKVDVQRHGTGVVRIRLTSGNDKQPMARIEQTNGVNDLTGWALLLVEPAGAPALFPFRGKLTVGFDVAAGVDSVLQSGTVSVLEEQLIGDTRYTANTESLDAGDRVQLRLAGTKSNPPPVLATVSGFVRAEPATGYSEPIDALNLVAHGEADFVQVDRLGSAGYKIRATRWARFLHDPLLAAGTAIVALFALLMEVGAKCGESILAYRRKGDADKGEIQTVDLAGNTDDNV